MMVSAWNFSRASMRLQYRLFQVSWIREINGISCSKDSSNSSFPVRYTPNISLKDEEEPTCSTPLKPTDNNKMKLSKRASLKLEAPLDRNTSVWSTEMSKKTQDQNQATLLSTNFDEKAESVSFYSTINISETDVMYKDMKARNVIPKVPNSEKSLPRNFMLDNEGANTSGSNEAQQGMQEELHYSLSADNDEYVEEIDEHSSQSCKSSIYDVEKMAIGLLATRAFTAFELRKKLQAKKFPLYMVNDVIMDLLSRGYINDSLYAETFSRSRWSSSTWGPRRIKQALSQKGISGVDAEKAIKEVFLESDPNREEEEPIMGMSKLSMDHLLAQAAKKWNRSENIPNEKRKARVISWLQYRGFNWGVIGFVLKKLEAKYSPP